MQHGMMRGSTVSSRTQVPFNSLFSHLSSEANFLMVIKRLQQFQASHPDLWKKDKSDFFFIIFVSLNQLGKHFLEGP